MFTRFLCLLVALLIVAAPRAIADGTETLGPPSLEIASGSGIAVGGVGLFADNDGTYTELDGDIFVAVPENAVVKQVILYWTGEFYPQTGGEDDTAIVNDIPVTGQPISERTNFFSVVYIRSYRADITNLGVISPGANTVRISGLDFSLHSVGAGIVVIYDDGTPADIQLQDGLDIAYWQYEQPLSVTIPVVFNFEPANEVRTARIPIFVGNVGTNRPNLTEVITGGQTTQFFNIYASLDGSQWDSQVLEVQVPAGASDLSVQLISASDGTANNPAAMSWSVAGFAIPLPDALPPCDTCQGNVNELTVQYVGAVRNAKIKIFQMTGLSSALAHQGTYNPGDVFTFRGRGAEGSFGNRLYFLVNNRYQGVLKTNCTQEVGPGSRAGNLLVQGGTSTQGGYLCPLGTGPVNGGDTCDDGKPSSLTFQYIPGSCPESVNDQTEPFVFCGGNATGLDQAYIVVSDNVNPLSPSARLFWHGQVNAGETFTVDAEAVGLSRFRSQIFVFILDRNYQPAQAVMLNSSCRQPLNVGDRFGSIVLTNFESADPLDTGFSWFSNTLRNTTLQRSLTRQTVTVNQALN